MDKITGWAWGNFRYIGDTAVFDDESTEGGYKCKLCSLHLKKRWDTFRKHIMDKHEDAIDDLNLIELSENICKIAIMCKFCKVPQKTAGHKLKKHMIQCQARSSQEASDEEKENQNEEYSDYEIESENESKDVEPDKKRQRKDLEQSPVEKINFHVKADLKKIEDENEKDKDELLKELERLRLENDDLRSTLEEKETELELVKKEQRNERLENSNMIVLLQEKESELMKLKENKDHANVEVEMLRKNFEKVDNANVKLNKEIKVLLQKNEQLKKIVKDSSKLESLEVEKVKNLDFIAEGGFGKVYKADYDGKQIALKEMKLDWSTIKELSVLLKVNSPYLMRATMFGIDWDSKNIAKSKITVAMDLCDTNLHTMLNLKKGKDTKWKLDIIKGAARALNELHKVPIIHNDIKPENMLIKNGILKLADFGLSEFGKVGVGGTGTPGFQAPEVIKSIKNNRPYTNKSDMWSLGATLYEVIVGDTLFPRGLPEKAMLNPEPKWEKTYEKETLKEVINECKELLMVDPKERPNAEKFATKVLRIQI